MIQLADTSGSGSSGGGSKITKVWYVDTEDEVFVCLAENPTYRGFLRLPGEWDFRTRDPNTIEAGFEVAITYGFVDPEDDDVSDEEYGADKAKWGFDPAFQQTAIEKNPEINVLIEDYGGFEDPQTHRVTFRRILQKSNEQGPLRDRRGLLGKNSQDSEGNTLNPLFGFNESGYISMSGIATARYLTSDVSRTLVGVGTVFQELPGSAPDLGLGDDRNWLKMPASVAESAREENGKIWYEVVDQFMLSEKGGWPEAVYKLIEI